MRTITPKTGYCDDCKFMRTWQENQSPLGSGLYWPETISECVFDDRLDGDIQIEDDDGIDKPCPAFEPVEIGHCDKHGDFLAREGCPGCLADELNEEREIAKRYHEQMEDES